MSTKTKSYKNHYKVLIVGGGTAGITVSARIKHQLGPAQIAIIEPTDKHFYRPLWTLVGAGVVDLKETERPMKDIIPKGVSWIQSKVKEFLPEKNTLQLSNGDEIRYDFLVVATGIEQKWDEIKGLKESLGKNGVCSNYSYQTVESTWEAFQNFKEGNALFTFPKGPITCGGAPQKIMYLAEHYLRLNGRRSKANVHYVSALPRIFGIEKYRHALENIIDQRNIHTHFKHHLIEVRGNEKVAIFEEVETKKILEMPFNLLHVTPPMHAPESIRRSSLIDSKGYVDVDANTLQHKKFFNIFSLGDVSNLPTAKTGAAIRKEAPELVKNLLSLMNGKELTGKYSGYSSCPLVTSYGKVMLAEFDYSGEPKETFPFDQSKERRSMYLLKRYLLPPLYWYGMLKGRA